MGSEEKIEVVQHTVGKAVAFASPSGFADASGVTGERIAVIWSRRRRAQDVADGRFAVAFASGVARRARSSTQCW